MTRPRLPEPTETFATTDGLMGVIASMWSTEEPEPQGSYTALLLTVRTEAPHYAVLHLMCDPDSDRWSLADVDSFYAVASAANHYAHLTGDDR